MANSAFACAPKQEIDDLFYKTAATVAFYVEEIDDIESNTLHWKSPSLISISPGMDRAETYFHPHKHSTHDAFNIVTNEINYLQYDWNEKRVNARQDSEEFVRYYFRMSESSTIESSRVYTFTDLMTKIGGLYVLIFGVGRTVGTGFNFFKHKAISFIKRDSRNRKLKRPIKNLKGRGLKTQCSTEKRLLVFIILSDASLQFTYEWLPFVFLFCNINVADDCIK